MVEKTEIGLRKIVFRKSAANEYSAKDLCSLRLYSRPNLAKLGESKFKVFVVTTIAATTMIVRLL